MHTFDAHSHMHECTHNTHTFVHFTYTQLVEDWNIDAESYSFSKLDPDCEEDKVIVNKFFLWEGDFGGREVADGKIFK